MRDFLATRNGTDLVQGLDIRGETSMNTENFAINKLQRREDVRTAGSECGISMQLLTAARVK